LLAFSTLAPGKRPLWRTRCSQTCDARTQGSIGSVGRAV